MIYQLVYTSKACVDMPLSERLELVKVSARNNLRRGLTGVLLYRSSRFIQILEGEQSVVEALLAKLRKDKRHTDVRVLATKLSDERDFSRWNMRLYNPDLCDEVARQTMEAWFEKADQGAQVDGDDIGLFLHHARDAARPRAEERQ